MTKTLFEPNINTYRFYLGLYPKSNFRVIPQSETLGNKMELFVLFLIFVLNIANLVMLVYLNQRNKAALL